MDPKETAGGGGNVPVFSVPSPFVVPPALDSAEWLRVMLSCIGDGVLATDLLGRVTFLNPVAQALTGWTQEEATAGGGVAIETVFNIVNDTSRVTVENPTVRALREGRIVGLASNTVLISKGGTEVPIDDNAAPIRNVKGEIAGAVLVFRDVTERARQETVDRRAFDYISNILETQRDPFLVLDKDLRVVSANRSFYQIFRVEKDATQGRFVYDLGDGQWNIPALRSLLEEVLPKDQAFDDFEVMHNFPAGVGHKTMLLNVRKILKPGNNSELILLAIKDISARKQAEQARQDSEVSSRFAQRAANAGAWTWDHGSALVSWSPECFELYGIDPNTKLIYESWCKALHPDDRERADQAATQAMERREDLNVEYRIQHPERGERWLSSIGRILDPVNRPGYMTGLAQDITERKRLERDMLGSEIRYRRLFQAAKDGVLILDATTGKITDANPFMSALTGFETGELLGKELHEIGMFKDAEANKTAFAELLRTRYLRHEHLPLQNWRGERVEVEFIANVYQEGDALVAQCNIRDIGERILLEKRVEKQAEELAQQARSKDEFLAMLSHELRNPLAPIRAAAHMMRLQERPGGAAANPILQEAREIIERQVANLTKMISDLSEVSRVISGRIRMDLQPVDMKEVVRHAVQSVTPLLEQRKHSVLLRSCSEPLWVQGDATRLEEVLVNLLNNAAKYTPDGGRIAVASELRHEGKKRYAMVRVRDNGVGMDESLVPRVFDLFTQGERSLDRAWGGLGIGLSLAHRLMTLHDGTIAAHSAGPGKGSEFTITLPLISAAIAPAESEAQPPRAHTSGPDGAKDQGAKKEAVRVLVVDDNVDLVTMLCGTLRLKGFDVQSAYTGPEGLRIAREWRPSIALLDIGLPGLDGYEIARRLRADQVLAVEAAGEGGVGSGGTVAKMKLIAITGYGREDDLALAKQAGFDGHMVKPCDMDKLDAMMAAPALSM